MYIKWVVDNPCFAHGTFGHFRFVVSERSVNADGTRWYTIHQYFEAKGASNKPLTLGKIKAKNIDEAVVYANNLITDTADTEEAHNKIAIPLHDGSTLVAESKGYRDATDGYQGFWIYRIGPDTATETDVATVEMCASSIGVYVFGDPDDSEHITTKTVIDVSDIK